MTIPSARFTGRRVLALILVVLMAIMSVAVYLFLLRRLRPVAGELSSEQALTELTWLLVLLLAAILLILLFVVGAYLLIRVGWMVSTPKVGGQPTNYVDGWSQYRITDEEIAAATREPRDQDDIDEPPGLPG